jgi:hypothetical protein
MTNQQLSILRLTLGLGTTVAVSYGVGWTLNFIAPIFAAVFLVIPRWIGWKPATLFVLMLGVALLCGLLISDFFLRMPLLCIPVFALLFFFIYFGDTPAAPPMAATFMTIGITMVPIMGLSGAVLPHIIAENMLLGLVVGLFFAWLFHGLIPGKPVPPGAAAQTAKPAPPPIPSRMERARLALVSTIVAMGAIIVFFSFNLSSYAYAMMQICLMAGAGSASASLKSMKYNAFTCLLGGIAIILVFNLLKIAPSWIFLVAVTMCTVLLFGQKIFSGSPMAKAWVSGLITFLVLLGTSTMPEATAANKFWLRIVQVIFAGLFTVAGLIIVERLLRPGRKRRKKTAAKTVCTIV